MINLGSIALTNNGKVITNLGNAGADAYGALYADNTLANDALKSGKSVFSDVINTGRATQIIRSNGNSAFYSKVDKRFIGVGSGGWLFQMIYAQNGATESQKKDFWRQINQFGLDVEKGLIKTSVLGASFIRDLRRMPINPYNVPDIVLQAEAENRSIDTRIDTEKKRQDLVREEAKTDRERIFQDVGTEKLKEKAKDELTPFYKTPGGMAAIGGGTLLVITGLAFALKN